MNVDRLRTQNQQNYMENTNTKNRLAAVDDVETVRRAVNAASINVLRVALYHQTKDPDLLAMQARQLPVRGGAFSTFVVPKEHHETIREKAFAFLCKESEILDHPDLQETASLMEMFTGMKPTQAELEYGFEELGFEDIPRNATWQSKPSQDKLNNFQVTIIGSGFSGMAAAIQLERLGIKYRILERFAGLGGTWYLNNYPEARVDIPTFSYQYKFEKNYPWKSYFAAQEELQEYAEHIATKYELKQHISFETSLKAATWNEENSCWDLLIENADKQQESYSTNVIISASGLFSTAKLPDITGIDRFAGKMFHTTNWDHDYDYSGKRVALIGTGSTGTQLARGVAQNAAKLSIFQRTANWVTPIKGYHAEVSDEIRWLLNNMPGYQNWFVYSNSISEFGAQDLHELDPEWIAAGGKVNAKNQALRESLTDFIHSKVGADSDLAAKLIPDHSPMSRRLVIDNSWYDTLLRDNVDLIAGGIKEITENGIVDENGVEHDFDLIILGAGFDVSKYMWPVEYKGKDGITLESKWRKDGARAFKGLTIPDFPNLFVIYGPNSQARAGGFHSIVECLSRYIGNLLTHMLENDKGEIAVKETVFQEYNQEMDEALSKLLWEDEQGGGGYYVNEHGRAGVIMPWRLHEFYELINHTDVENYNIS